MGIDKVLSHGTVHRKMSFRLPKGSVEETAVSDVEETNLQLRIDTTEFKASIHVPGKGNNPSNLFVLKVRFLSKLGEERREGKG